MKAKELVKSWSYSRFADYRQCPQKFKFKHIDKLEEPKSPAMERGSLIHDNLEGFVLGYKKTLPKELTDSMGKVMMAELKTLKKEKAVPEQQAAFDREWNIVPWNDWDRAWLRVIIDLSAASEVAARVIDYKSGKIKEAEHADQLELYGIYGFLKFPQVKEVYCEPWYVDHSIMGTPLVFTDRARELPRLQKKWTNAVAPMFRDKQFKPTPNLLCKWCPYSGRTGGPCTKG